MGEEIKRIAVWEEGEGRNRGWEEEERKRKERYGRENNSKEK